MQIDKDQSPNPQPKALTVAEYFAGIGLVRMGLEQQGWSVTFANDISEKSARCTAHSSHNNTVIM